MTDYRQRPPSEMRDRLKQHARDIAREEVQREEREGRKTPQQVRDVVRREGDRRK